MVFVLRVRVVCVTFFVRLRLPVGVGVWLCAFVLVNEAKLMYQFIHVDAGLCMGRV